MTIKKIRPMYTHIVTTMDMYIDEQLKSPGGIIDASKLKKGIKEYQKVIAIGNSVRTVNVGDLVCINPERYAVRAYDENSVKRDLMQNQIVKYNFNVVKLDGKDYLLLDESDVDFIIDEYEE